MKGSALSIRALGDVIEGIATQGRVLMLLDACRSGSSVVAASKPFKSMLADGNLSVLASCAPGESSYENADWENGAFTEALLAAFSKADSKGSSGP